MDPSTKFRNRLTVIRLHALAGLLAALPLVSIAPLKAEPLASEKIKRFQSLTLSGQITDDTYYLGRVASKFSKKRLCLVLFGDPSENGTKTARTNATETLKYMARQGHNMALLHVDTTVYSKSPQELLKNEDDKFVSPSFLIYVDGAQMSYHPTVSPDEIRHIKAAMVIYEPEVMGWAEKLRDEDASQKASEQRE